MLSHTYTTSSPTALPILSSNRTKSVLVVLTRVNDVQEIEVHVHDHELGHLVISQPVADEGVTDFRVEKDFHSYIRLVLGVVQVLIDNKTSMVG